MPLVPPVILTAPWIFTSSTGIRAPGAIHRQLNPRDLPIREDKKGSSCPGHDRWPASPLDPPVIIDLGHLKTTPLVSGFTSGVSFTVESMRPVRVGQLLWDHQIIPCLIRMDPHIAPFRVHFHAVSETQILPHNSCAGFAFSLRAWLSGVLPFKVLLILNHLSFRFIPLWIVDLDTIPHPERLVHGHPSDLLEFIFIQVLKVLRVSTTVRTKASA